MVRGRCTAVTWLQKERCPARARMRCEVMVAARGSCRKKCIRPNRPHDVALSPPAPNLPLPSLRRVKIVFARI